MTVEIRPLAREELGRVGEIDRSERIDALYVQEGARLSVREGDWSSPPWDAEGEGEHSVAAQRRELERLVDVGGTALGAFEGDAFVGVGAVVTALRPGVAQLAYLYVTRERRSAGIGARLCDELEHVARRAGSTSVVASATPSVATVDFYRRRGYEPMAEPLPELLELEPEDVHMEKAL